MYSVCHQQKGHINYSVDDHEAHAEVVEDQSNHVMSAACVWVLVLPSVVVVVAPKKLSAPRSATGVAWEVWVATCTH